jgi:hypothetical protein
MHEAGHAFMASCLGFKIFTVTARDRDAHTAYGGKSPSDFDAALIALAGPLACAIKFGPYHPGARESTADAVFTARVSGVELERATARARQLLLDNWSVVEILAGSLSRSKDKSQEVTP